MNRSAAAIVFVWFAAICAFGQQDTSVRPRVARTPTPPVLDNRTVQRSTNGGPPVLIGGARNEPQPTPTPGSGENDDIIRVETNLVTMPVSVLDREGRFVSGLRQQDFRIYENGVEQKIEYFQSVEQPFAVVLMIDVSPSTQFRIEEIQDAAIAFIDQLRPSDRVMVVSFDQNVHILSPFTNNRYQLRDAIRQARFGDGTGLYESVHYVLDRELSQFNGRKAVVIFTDGVDTTSRRASYQSTVQETEEADSLFYTIRYDTSNDMGRGTMGYPGRRPGRRGGRVTMSDILAGILLGGQVNIGNGAPGGATNAEYETGRRYLQTLSQNTGGRSFEANSMTNVDAAFNGIAEELRRQYSLGYYPESVGRAGERKQIKIRVMRPDVVVRAKTSYIVGDVDRKFAGR